MRKCRDTKLVTSKARWNHLVSEPNYHPPKIFSGCLLVKKMKKNANIYELTSLFSSSIIGSQSNSNVWLWYDYVKRKSKIILHEYRQLYSQHKNRIHLHRYLLLNMLKQDLILQTMSTKDHYPGKKIKKSDQKHPSRGVLSCKATLLK